MAAAENFRRVAEKLAELAVTEVDKLDGGDAADYLRDMAHAGKAAMEASKAAELDAASVSAALREIEEELTDAGLLDVSMAMPLEEFLQFVFVELVKLREQAGRGKTRLDALRDGYEILGGRLLRITEQAEATEQPTSLRVAMQNRAAIDEAIVALEAAGLSVPLQPRSAT